MRETVPDVGLALRTLVTAEGELQLSLVEVPVQAPGEGEILVRVEAAPINPSDAGLLVGPADLSTLKSDGRRTTARIPPHLMATVAARVGQALPAGVEGAGVVIAAGPDAVSQALIGRRVAVFGGLMLAQYRIAPTAAVLPLPEGLAARDGAAAFANPLTALAMVESLALEGHKALVHTAAASNLGQMLNRICLADGVGLVNIVRSPAQARLLREQGAIHVVDSTSPTFAADLVAALSATDATLAFDAVGGGPLADQILAAMEQAQAAKLGGYSRYGSSARKQVHIYGGLSTVPTALSRTYGMSWGVGGWILTEFLSRIGAEGVARLRRRIVSELTTTFASRYASEVSLSEAIRPEAVVAWARKSTGGKHLVVPNLG